MSLPTTFFGWIQLLIEKYGPLFLNGAGFTMLIAISGTVLGFLLGLLVAIVRTIPVSKKDNIFKRILMKLVNIILNVYIEVFRGTPMIVQAMVIFYGSMMYLGLRMPAHQYRRLHGGNHPRRYHQRGQGPEGSRPCHRHDPLAEHGACGIAPGGTQHHALHRQ